MASRNKVRPRSVSSSSQKRQLKEQDSESNRQFISVLIIATLTLIVLMYFIFRSSQ